MERTWSWAVTGYQLAYDTTPERIKICKHAGISSVEANPAFCEGKTSKELEDMRRQYEKSGLSLASFHLPKGETGEDAASLYEAHRIDSVKLLAEMLEKAALLGSRVAILHPSTSRFSVEESGTEKYLSQLAKTLDTLIKKAEGLGIIIALENMLPGLKGFRLGSHPEHFVLFAEKFASPNLGFCLDTGHALVSMGADGPSSFFSVMSKNLRAFHLHDNAGDRDSHLAPGHGLVDWTLVFKSMADMKFKHSACIEAPPFNYAKNGRYPADAWNRMIEDADSLVGKLYENTYA